jgi:hypothetical protein
MAMLYSWENFEFWYLVIMTGLIRLNNSSLYLTVLIRRQLYYLSPKVLKALFAMDETPLGLKGKHGAYLEHTATWIFFLYFFWISKSSLPFYTRDITSISNCGFQNEHWDSILLWYTPMIIYAFFILIEILAVLLNKKM